MQVGLRFACNGDIWDLLPALRIVLYEQGFAIELAWLNWSVVLDISEVSHVH